MTEPLRRPPIFLIKKNYSPENSHREVLGGTYQVFSSMGEEIGNMRFLSGFGIKTDRFQRLGALFHPFVSKELCRINYVMLS